MFSARWTGSIKGYLGFGKSNSILFRKWVVVQTDLRPIDGLKSFAYVLLYLLMGDIPWCIPHCRAGFHGFDDPCGYSRWVSLLLGL